MPPLSSRNANAPRVLITAGPTAEDIDPVRFITNRSTGRMGIELAAAVIRRGGTPLLILGPTHLEPPPGAATVRIRSAAEMNAAVHEHLGWAQSLVMAAAVADYAPAELLRGKLKKQEGDLFLRLVRTQDVLAGIRDLPARRGKYVVGFSLDVVENIGEGRRKLVEKELDLIVVNTTASFGADHEQANLISADSTETLGEIGKDALADLIVSRILAYLKMKC